MSTVNQPEVGEDVVTQDTVGMDFSEDERTALIRQADLLGIQFHPSLSTDKLRDRVRAKLSETAADLSSGQTQPSRLEETKEESENERRARLRADAARLIRVHITCMDPAKKEYQGEVFTAGNAVVGSFRKFVLFNEPYHIPNIIYKQLLDKKCQIFVDVKGDRGQKTRKGKQINAYAIQVLPPLTPEELAELREDQRARKD